MLEPLLFDYRISWGHSLIKCFDEVYILRSEVNQYADGLYKLGSKKALDFVVFENPLPVVLPLLVFDKASGICNMCIFGQLIYIPFFNPPPKKKHYVNSISWKV